MNSIGHFGPAMSLVALAFTRCNPTLAIFWLCMSVMLTGANYSGFGVNHVELSPNYAGTLMGITNGAANLTGFAAPYFTGWLVNSHVRPIKMENS